MPRKDFQNHLKEAQAGALPTNIISLKAGDDDGTFVLVFERPGLPSIRIQCQASDVGDYPRSHSFFVFTDSEDVPKSVGSALQGLSIVAESSISQTIKDIAQILNDVTNPVGPSSDVEMDDEEDVEEDEDFSDADLEEGFYPFADNYVQDEDMDDSTARFHGQGRRSTHTTQLSAKDRADRSKRLQSDLKIVKEAGFRVAHHGDLLQPAQCYLMISIRVAKLGIPEDALEAWHLQPSEYVMLLIKYHDGYRSLELLKDCSRSNRELTMHVLVTKRHKLTDQEIIDAIGSNGGKDDDVVDDLDISEKVTRCLFIGSALDELLNSRLLILIQYRLGNAFTWSGAMSYYNDSQGTSDVTATDRSRYLPDDDKGHVDGLPAIVTADHISKKAGYKSGDLSFPLIAMQFTLRHIVRCTDFCLVCFDRTKEDFEALKPYVCSKPLCLYQYMSMGLGPGIEFEVLSQPHVVDLLVSFCYNSASASSLKNLPTGLSMMVPNPRLIKGLLQSDSYYGIQAIDLLGNPVSGSSSIGKRARSDDKASFTTSTTITLHEDLKELRVTADAKSDRAFAALKEGQWVALRTLGCDIYHCKITDISHPVYRYQALIKASSSLSGITASSKQNTISEDKKEEANKIGAGSMEKSVCLIPYNKLFDELEVKDKQSVLCSLLDTLPDVFEMGDWLKTARGNKAKLSKWTERIIPSALSMLRWIIASNRSCIVYTGDGFKGEQIDGMPGYLQFKFASGAPDKESRFLREVNNAKARLNTKNPTIFAWHGSPVKNWHSIIREGLNFDNVVNGRAYGNGIYHAMDAATSTGYAGAHHAYQDNSGKWPSSILGVQSALSLNEIVNAPNEFQSKAPYLVVQHVNWVQTRYLFVQATTSLAKGTTVKPKSILAQEPAYTPRDLHKPIVIPSCAISKSRQQTLKATGSSSSKSSKRKSATELDRSGMISEDSDEEDMVLYFEDKAEPVKKPDNVMDFQPGSLDRNSLPMLAAPSYATPASSKALHREIKAMLKEQDETPLHELGWYMDPEHIDNPYQWIVELHSFDKSLPLAQDMKSQKLSSIILEVRFGATFNFSPPFIRVIKPRFLPFQQGGGGHVTAGGALCMQLLTSDGWNPSSTMAAVLLQVRMAITSLDPKPARLDRGGIMEQYGVGEAVDAYIRACNTHGWKVPDDFKAMSAMASASFVVKKDLIDLDGRVSGFKNGDYDDDDDAVALTPAATPGTSGRGTSFKKQKRQ